MNNCDNIMEHFFASLEGHPKLAGLVEDVEDENFKGEMKKSSKTRDFEFVFGGFWENAEEEDGKEEIVGHC